MAISGSVVIVAAAFGRYRHGAYVDDRANAALSILILTAFNFGRPHQEHETAQAVRATGRDRS